MPACVQSRLTVLIVTYNHAAYIRRAVESVLMQRLSEPYVVIVADDNSSDDTRKIINEMFAASSPCPPFSYLDHTINRGITENYRRSFAACETDYVAVIEGDDYWINPGKLEAQMAFLDEHFECNAVSANYFVYDEDDARFTARTAINSEFSYIDARHLIYDNLIGNFSTCMYRVGALKAIPDLLYRSTAYDWGVNICVARDALIGFLHTPFSVYRVHKQGAWNKLNQQARSATQLEFIEHYNKCTDFVFDDEFQALSHRLRPSLPVSMTPRSGRRRLTAILLACIPPGIIAISKLFARLIKQFVLPPIIPIAIKKIRRDPS